MKPGTITPARTAIRGTATDGTCEFVLESVRQKFDGPPEYNPDSWQVRGVYRGVEMSFLYSTPEVPDHDDMATRPPDLDTTVVADLPKDYPLHLRLEPRAVDRTEPPTAPFFATVQGTAAPIDIATQLLNSHVCDELRQLGRFTLRTYGVASPKWSNISLSLSVPYWVERADVARRMLDIVRRLVLALDKARAAADAAATESEGPFRSIGPDLEKLHQRRLAEIKAAGGDRAWYRVSSLSTLQEWLITILIFVVLFLVVWGIRCVA